MRALAPSTKASAVEPSVTRDVTERELAPFVRPPPAPATPADAVRSRKKTLVSPIPALLAASMGEIREEEEHVEATPLPIDLRADETSRFEAADQRALLDGEADYVVEVVNTHKTRT